MVKHLFLDLEDTIITPVVNSWGAVDFINTERIKNFIETWQPDHVHIFSFAIWNLHELQKFNDLLRPHLEHNLGVRFEIVPTVDDNILPACRKVKNIQVVDFSEMSAFWGKGGAFHLFVKHWFGPKPTEQVQVVLIDDMVDDETFVWPNRNIAGSLINVDGMV